MTSDCAGPAIVSCVGRPRRHDRSTFNPPLAQMPLILPVGHAAGSPKQEAKGLARQAAGNVQKAYGDVKEAAKRAADDAE